MSVLDGWCAFHGFGQWDCDDAPCDNEASFQVGGFGMQPVQVCVRHMGYAVAADLGDEATVYSIERLRRKAEK